MPETYPPSPVPSDERLLPGEKPFTAFGQFGPDKMDNRVFDQDIYWVNRLGEPFRLEEMTPEYRANVIKFLRESAAYFHIHAVIRTIADIAVDVELGRVHGELIARSLGFPTIADLTAEEWLEATPLMRRLRALNQQA